MTKRDLKNIIKNLLKEEMDAANNPAPAPTDGEPPMDGGAPTEDTSEVTIKISKDAAHALMSALEGALADEEAGSEPTAPEGPQKPPTPAPSGAPPVAEGKCKHKCSSRRKKVKTGY